MSLLRTLPALLLVAALAVPASASAQVSDKGYEETPKWFTSGLSFGAVWFSDSQLEPTYGTKARFLSKVNFGFVPWSKYMHVEINAGVGFQQFTGTQVFVDDGGDSTGSTMMMTVLPVTVDLLVGLDIFFEQPVVPYGGIGLAMAFWRENETGGGEEYTGDRFGFNGFFGAAILLDALERTRSQHLDVTTGINDAYITVEGRWSDVGTQIRDGVTTTDGLQFGGWSVLGGLKLVY
ncbi:MAG: hypothetical protein GY898_09835 [Proteobacteria bacterium]|nr:hypothetical protein [Pseudomonadota bacterium]